MTLFGSVGLTAIVVSLRMLTVPSVSQLSRKLPAKSAGCEATEVLHATPAIVPRPGPPDPLGRVSLKFPKAKKPERLSRGWSIGLRRAALPIVLAANVSSARSAVTRASWRIADLPKHDANPGIMRSCAAASRIAALRPAVWVTAGQSALVPVRRT